MVLSGSLAHYKVNKCHHCGFTWNPEGEKSNLGGWGRKEVLSPLPTHTTHTWELTHSRKCGQGLIGVAGCPVVPTADSSRMWRLPQDGVRFPSVEGTPSFLLPQPPGLEWVAPTTDPYAITQVPRPNQGAPLIPPGAHEDHVWLWGLF